MFDVYIENFYVYLGVKCYRFVNLFLIKKW